MLDISQCRELLIKPSLSIIKLYSSDAEELLVATLANESLGGTYLAQKSGPAVGIFQMESATYHDIWGNYLLYKKQLTFDVLKSNNYSSKPAVDEMICNLRFACQMARIHYLRISDPLPKGDDLDGIWEYYKQYYNTRLGKATKEEFIKNYYRFTGKKKAVIA